MHYSRHADLRVTRRLLCIMANKSKQAASVVDPALQMKALVVTEDRNSGGAALGIHDDDKHVNVAVELQHGVDRCNGLGFGADPLSKWIMLQTM